MGRRQEAGERTMMRSLFDWIVWAMRLIVMLGTGIMVLFIVLIIGHLAYVGLAKLIGK
jgi:hypothetical protein